jgi:beta-N-acetylhexosaminidase
LILFKRNVASQEQLLILTQSFRDCVGRENAPVLIDQEGGRVQRLGPPHWPAYPAAAAYLGLESGVGAVEAATLGARLIAADLRQAGITVDCAPVLDVPAPGSHQVIGNRAFGTDPDTVAQLGRAFAEGLLAGGVLPVIKHMPGHGRAGVDSHLHLPVVTATRADLESVDFPPFRALADLPMGMTAHVVFTSLDPDHPATASRIVIQTVIRELIGFSGLLLSDDLSMEALKGTLGERARAAVDAGCDIILHCNGKLDEAQAVAAMARPLEGESERRAERALAHITSILPGADEGLRERFKVLTSAVA